MFSSFNKTVDQNLGSPQILKKIAQAMKEAGVEELAAINLEQIDASSLFGIGGRLARRNIVAVGDELESIKLPPDVEPLRFVLQNAQLDPVPTGKVVVVCCSIQERSGRMSALVFSKQNENLILESAPFLACA
jgi:hypothetical protein